MECKFVKEVASCDVNTKAKNVMQAYSSGKDYFTMFAGNNNADEWELYWKVLAFLNVLDCCQPWCHNMGFDMIHWNDWNVKLSTNSLRKVDTNS